MNWIQQRKEATGSYLNPIRPSRADWHADGFEDYFSQWSRLLPRPILLTADGADFMDAEAGDPGTEFPSAVSLGLSWFVVA